MAFTTETGFNTTLAQKLDAGGSDTEIALAALPITVTKGVMLIGSGNNKEWVYFGTVDAGSTEIRTCTRGLDKDATSTSDSTSSNILSHRVGDPVRLVQHSLMQNAKPDGDASETISGDWVFSGSVRVPVYADATARDAAITSPANGMAVYNTADGKFQDYTAGSWIDRESGGTFPNATTSVAGKLEIATQAELNAGTDTGGTGASIVGVPSNLAVASQDNKWIYFASSAGSDTYAITATPAVTAYAAGQEFIVNPDTANTGACTLNVNALGAKDIKKVVNGALADPETSDIIANNPFTVVYDGTRFVMSSPWGGLMSTANSDTLTGGSDASALHAHDTVQSWFNISRIELHNGWNLQVGNNGTFTELGSGLQCQSDATGAGEYAMTQINAAQFTVAAKNVRFFARVRYVATTAQDGFIGLDDGTTNTTNHNATETTDHVGFLIADGALYASVADGATQEKSSDLSGSYAIDTIHEYYIEPSGSNYKFYIDGNLVHTSTANNPNSGIQNANIGVVSSAAAAKTVIVHQHAISFDE